MKSKKLNRSGQVRGSIAGQDYITHEHELIATLAATIFAAGMRNDGDDVLPVQHAVEMARAILGEAMTVDAKAKAAAADAAKESKS